jgi:hypothetical protein
MIDFRSYYTISLIGESAFMSYAEFSKKKTDKRPDRKKIFLDRYKNGQFFKVKKDGVEKDVIFDYNADIAQSIEDLSVGNPNKKSPEYIAAKKIYDSIELSDATSPGDKYSLNDLLKTGEFKGKGSGGGSENTKINEASVCLWAAVYQEASAASLPIVRRLAKEKSVTKFYETDEDVDKMIDQQDKGWLDHYERVAEFIKTKIADGGNFVFHRNSAFVQAIYNKFNSLNIVSVDPFGNSNKWNPSDIWAVSASVSEQEVLDKVKGTPDIITLNNILIELYNQKHVIGISLKRTKNAVHSREYNLNETRPIVTYLSHEVGEGRKGILSKDVYINCLYRHNVDEPEEDCSLQFRSFVAWQNFQAEIKGEFAAGGRISHGIINKVLKRNNLEELPSVEEVRVKAADPEQSTIMLRDIFDMFVKLGGPVTPEIRDADALIQAINPSTDNQQAKSNVSEDYTFSKYFGLKFLSILNTLNSDVKNKIMTELITYAASSSKESGPFVKVYQS